MVPCNRLLLIAVITTVFSAYFSLAGNYCLARDLVIGSISEDPREEVETFTPFATYLAQNLSTLGISGGKVRVVKDMDKMAELLKSGDVDLYIDSPFPILYVQKKSGAKILLRRWKKGVKEYHSVIFVRKDSGIENLSDLQGKLIGFEEAWSSSAYFLPKLSIVSKGLGVSEKRNFKSTVSENEIGYVFTTSDTNTMFWTLKKRIAAGAMSERRMKKKASDRLDEIKVIHKTFPIPRHIVLHSANLSQEMRDGIKKILLEMHLQGDGKTVLQNFESTTRFDEIPAESLDKMIQGLQFMGL